MTTLRVERPSMAKVQFVATAVALRGWRKLEDTGSALIEDALPSARRAFGIAVCQHRAVRSRRAAVSIGAAALATWVLQGAAMPAAQAAPCPDAEVVFARGTTE